MSPHRTPTGRRPLALAAGAAALAASTSSPFAGRPARAQGASSAAQAQAQAPGFYRFKVGGLTVTTLHDGYQRRPAVDRSLVRNVAPAELQAALRESFLPTTHCDIPITVTFVETQRGLVALDGGTGGQAARRGLGMLDRERHRRDPTLPRATDVGAATLRR